MVSCDWLLSLHGGFKVQAIACSNTEFLFTVKYCSTIQIRHVLFLRLSVDGHLFCVTLLATGIAVQVFVGTYVFIFHGCIYLGPMAVKAPSPNCCTS